MKKIYFALFLLPILLNSCSSVYSYYSAILDTTESPTIKVENCNNHFNDEFIDIVWNVSDKAFGFVLENKTKQSLKINWNDISYVDMNGYVDRVIHQGVKLINKNSESQIPTTLPGNSKISDILVPTKNISWWSGGSWNYECLIKCETCLKRDINYTDTSYYFGKTMKILFPIEIGGEKKDYNFEFIINEKKIR